MGKAMSEDYSDILPKGAIFEMLPQGAYVKVSAVDPVTRLEVSIVGDRSARIDALKIIVLRKLARAVEKSRQSPGKVMKRRDDPPSGWDL